MKNAIDAEFDQFNIVVVGKFNPAIFHPMWYSANGLIRKEESETANLELIHEKVAIFTIDSWCRFQVTTDRFIVETRDLTKREAIRDLAAGTFEILEHTPVSAFGFNRVRTYQMKSEAEWHAFGNLLAPKGPWAAILTEPGLRNLVIEGNRSNCEAKYIQIRIDPTLETGPFGISIRINEHHELSNADPPVGRDVIPTFLRRLRAGLQGFLGYSNGVPQDLFSFRERTEG